jgi:TBC1 domain family member 8/9
MIVTRNLVSSGSELGADTYLSAISGFIHHAFEYAENHSEVPIISADLEVPDVVAANAALDPSKRLYITLPTLRMIILADETLERLFDYVLPSTIVLTPSQVQPSQPGLLRGLFDNLVSEGARTVGEVRRRIDEVSKEVEEAMRAERERAMGFQPPVKRELSREEEEEEIGLGKSVSARDRELLREVPETRSLSDSQDNKSDASTNVAENTKGRGSNVSGVATGDELIGILPWWFHC